MSPDGSLYQRTDNGEGNVVLKNLEDEGVIKTLTYGNIFLKSLLPLIDETELEDVKKMNRHERRKFYKLNKHRINDKRIQ